MFRRWLSFSPAILGACWILLTLPFTALGVSPSAYQGYWQIPEQAGDNCILIVKAGGDASCFWTSSSQKIEKGRWEMRGEEMVVTWASGYQDVYSIVSEYTLNRRSYAPGADLSGPPRHEARAVRMDPRVPGSLANPSAPGAVRPAEATPTPEAEPESPLAASLRNDYVGYWRLAQDTGGFRLWGGSRGPEYFYLHLGRGGEAKTALRSGAATRQTGSWKSEDGLAVVTWADGQIDTLEVHDDGTVTLRNYAQAQARERQRVQQEHQGERLSPIEAMAYFRDAETNLFTAMEMRGLWTPDRKLAEAAPRGIRIKGWGQAERLDDVGADPVQGSWQLLSDRVNITWDDGHQDVIRLAGRGFVIERFPKGESLNGTPAFVTGIQRSSTNEEAPLAAAR